MPELKLPRLSQFTGCGRLTKPPELKHTPNGTQFAEFSIAVDTAGSGDNKQTSFFDITAWGKLADYVCDNLTTGDPVLITGRLEIRRWKTDTSHGTQVKITAQEIMTLAWKQKPDTSMPEPEPDKNDDLPF